MFCFFVTYLLLALQYEGMGVGERFGCGGGVCVCVWAGRVGVFIKGVIQPKI